MVTCEWLQFAPIFFEMKFDTNEWSSVVVLNTAVLQRDKLSL